MATLTPEFPATKQDTTDHSAQDILRSEQTGAQWLASNQRTGKNKKQSTMQKG